MCDLVLISPGTMVFLDNFKAKLSPRTPLFLEGQVQVTSYQAVPYQINYLLYIDV